jgi:phosphoribosylformylglycinamidine synthase I
MAKQSAAVIVFPGSNCDEDAKFALENAGFDVSMVWHEENRELDYGLLFIPGGFSYGDYLRAGALATFSPIMKRVKEFVQNEVGLTLGVCNGFQILTESKILPGSLSRNENLKFICKDVEIEVVNHLSPFTKYMPKRRLILPIAHAEGRYVIENEKLRKLEMENRVAFRYKENLNGSMNNIAGILNDKFNVLGMMPHPERNSIQLLGNGDGLEILLSIRRYLENDR